MPGAFIVAESEPGIGTRHSKSAGESVCRGWSYCEVQVGRATGHVVLLCKLGSHEVELRKPASSLAPVNRVIFGLTPIMFGLSCTSINSRETS